MKRLIARVAAYVVCKFVDFLAFALEEASVGFFGFLESKRKKGKLSEPCQLFCDCSRHEREYYSCPPYGAVLRYDGG
jgi:hypothetical protein